MNSMYLDCGTTPIWWYAKTSLDIDYCRRCALKGGHQYLAEVKIDPDKLANWLKTLLSDKSDQAAQQAVFNLVINCFSD